jgi:aryl-alcohol dehydrogenase-like predicted oxidoreductase
MITAVIILPLTVFWISVVVVLGAFSYTATPFVRTIAAPKLAGKRRRFCLASPVSDARNNHDDLTVNRDDLDEDPLVILPPEIPQKSIVWSVSSGVTEFQKTPRELLPFPYVPTLDASGLLPRSTYYCRPSNSATETKPTCRLQIAWDIAPPSSNSMMDVTPEDREFMVSAMQNAVDHGLTTFQMKTYAHSQCNRLQDELYQLFLKDTPKSVVNEQCEIIVPLQIQDVVATTPGRETVSSLSVRTAITTLLDRLQSDCLDNVQISFPQQMRVPSDIPILDDNRFHLDLLYELQELQRAGHIRSISTKGLSSDFYTNAVQPAGLHTLISSNVMDASLCRIQPLLRHHLYCHRQKSKKPSVTTHVPFSVAANPLAGSWLTDRYLLLDTQNYRGSSKSSISSSPDWFSKLSAPEKANWNRNVVQGGWTRHREWSGNEEDINEPPSFRSTWEMYRAQVMTPLQEIARKHDVATASIALRWLLQADRKNFPAENEQIYPLLASTVVSCRLLPEHFCWDRPYTYPSKRIQQLREVVKFELDEDDMECLWTLSGGNTHESALGDTDETWLSSDEDRLEASSTGLFLPKRK